MYRKFLINMTAIVTAFSMSVAPTVIVFAEEDDTTMDSDVDTGTVIDSDRTETIYSDPNSEITVNGNITVDNGSNAVYADGGDVTVNGDIEVSGQNTYEIDGEKNTSASDAIYAANSATVTVNGDVSSKDGGDGICAFGEGTSVVVEGDIDAAGATKYTGSDGNEHYNGADGAYVSNGASILVDGNITGANVGIANYDYDGSQTTVMVNGDVKATGVDQTYHKYNPKTGKNDIPVNSVQGDGIQTTGNGNIYIDGDVTGASSGVIIIPNDDDTKGTIVVTGNISSSSGSGLHVSTLWENNQPEYLYDDTDDFLDDVPEIVINETASLGVSAYFKDGDGYTSNSEALDKVIKAVNYIINVDEKAKEAYDISVSGENVKSIAGYDTVNINEAFSVAANLTSDFTISGGENVEVIDNSDGTYTLTLKSLKGRINITAVLRPTSDGSVEVADLVENTTQTAASSSESSSNSSSSNVNDAVQSGAIVINTSTPAAGTTSPISGDKAARSLSLDLGKITPVQYRDAIIENVVKAPSNGALNIETDRVSFLDKNMIGKIATRPDLDVNVVFTYLGKKMKITIPAGYDVNSLLDENGYCGFLRLLSILGGTEL